MIFQEILKLVVEQEQLATSSATASSWFRNSLQTLNVSPQTVIRKETNQLTPYIYPGVLTLFKYRATNQKPYYDSFPLVFFLENTDNGFMGLNLHYISYQQRAIIMDELQTNASNQITQRAANYQFLKKIQRHRYFNPCVKKYLYSNVKSRFLSISPEYWNIALFLPLERFIGSSKEHVWSDSTLKISKGKYGK